MGDITTSWSHTQFEKFTACPRRYYYNYILDKREKDSAGIAAQFSSALVHPTLASMYMGNAITDLDEIYDTWINDVGVMVRLQPQYSVETLQKILVVYERVVAADLLQYAVKVTEPRLTVVIGKAQIVVKPDVVLFGDDGLIPLDFKVSGYDQPKNRLPYNNQFVGQCIAVGATQYFCDSITVTKSGKVSRERNVVMVSDELIEEWFAEQEITIAARNMAFFTNTWPKFSQNCYQFNQPCPFMSACSAGRRFGEGLL